MNGYEAIHKYAAVYEMAKLLYTPICMHEQDIIFLFSASGPEAEHNMAQLTAYARSMGSISIRRVGREEQGESDSPVKATAALLSAFLATPGLYREKWSEYISIRGEAPIHQGAITRVISKWYAQAHPEEQPITSRSLRSKVSRALSGDALTAQTLDWFISSFDFDDTHAQQLRETLNPGSAVPMESATENG